MRLLEDKRQEFAAVYAVTDAHITLGAWEGTVSFIAVDGNVGRQEDLKIL